MPECNKKTSRGGGFTIRVTNVFRFPKTGLFVGMHNCLNGFPQALPEIKNGKVTDYKRCKKEKPFLSFRI
jgi:hypothetical protein